MKTAEHGPDFASLRVLVDSLPALIHTGLPDGYLDFFNQRWLEFVGLRLEDLEGWKWTAAVHPDDVTGLVAGWRACLASGEPLEFEARVRRADGEYRWMLHHKVALRDECGQIVKWYGSSIDIEDRKRAECRSRELRQILDLTPQHLEAHLQATLNVIPAHTWYAPPSGALTFVNARCADYLGLPKDHPLRFGIDTGAAWDSHIPLLHPDDHEESRRIWSTCLRTGSVADISFRVRNAEGTYRWFLSRVEPLRANDGTLLYWVGVNLDIEERKQAEKKLQEQQLELRQMLDFRREAEEALRRSEAWLSEAQRLSHTGSWVLDLETSELKHWSPELLRICGFDPDAGIPSTEAVRERTHPEDRAKNVEEIETAIRERTGVAGERRLVLPDGTIRHLQIVVSPVFDAAGRPIEVIGTAMDVTERKCAEEALRESEERYRALIEVSPQMVWLARADGSNIFWNQWWYDYTGLTRAESEEFGWVQALHPEHRDRWVDSWRQALASGGEWNTEAPLRRADGQYRWHLGRGLPIRDADGRIVRWMGIGVDIHDRREAEEALRESEQRYRRSEAYLAEAQRLSHTGNWAMNLETRQVVYWSQELFRLFGFDPEEGIPSTEGMLRRIHPDDRARVLAALRRAVREKTDYDFDCRVVRPDGTTRHLHTAFSPTVNAAGDTEDMIGTVMDTTAGKQAEEALRASEQRYRNIFEKVGVAIVEEDFSRVMARLGDLKARGVRDFRRYLAEHPELARETFASVKVTDANEAAVALFGAASKQEFFDALPRLATREVKAAWVAQLIAVAEGRRSVEEVVLTTIGGETVHTLVALVLPPESSGYHSVLVTVVDLSERKRAEEAMNQAQAALAHVTRVTTLGELTASIAHEVNQPLAAIVNNASACLALLSHGRADVDELRAALADINSDAERAGAVIERVRAMAKRSAPERIPVRLTDLVHEVVALTAAESAARRVAIRTDVPADLPLVLGDRVQLQQVLLNLVVNAMDAMSSADERDRSLDIRGRVDGDDGSPGVTISVEDRGGGLQPEELDRLFEAFYTTKPHGMGLGLAISRSIIDAHGGRLWGESNRGRGAVFSFRLPATETSRAA